MNYYPIKLRYVKAFQGLTENPVIKFIFSLLGTAWASLQDVIVAEPVLVTACIIVFILDALTGIQRSRKDGVKITSFGLRQLGVKIIEYGTVILFFTVLAYGFGRLEGGGWVSNLLSVLRNVHYLAYFWVVWTEGLSIYENIGGDQSRFRELWDMVKDKLFKQ